MFTYPMFYTSLTTSLAPTVHSHVTKFYCARKLKKKGATVSDDPAQMTIAEAGTAIKAGNLKPSALIEACLERTSLRDPEVMAWAFLGGDQARMAARLLDTWQSDNVLHGIPFGVKDIIDTADMPTEHGTPIYNGHRPARDAACVSLLKEAGGVCFGKTVTTELAHFHPGKTRNPWALTHTPGGSSSGSAAAVAAGMVPFALGTQTTGSVLRPASYCGVYGFKPSYGDVVRSGVFECAASFDTIGWFTRSVEDIEIVRRALIRAPAAPLTPVELGKLRIGVVRGPEWKSADEHTRKSVESAADHLRTKAASVEEFKLPAGFDNIAVHHRMIAGYEFARAITWERTNRPHQLSKKLVEGRCEDGVQCSYEVYANAQAELLSLRATMQQVMENYDVLLTATAPGEAWGGRQATGDPAFNTAWTALHMPSVSVPAFIGASGLPIGLQLIGRFRHDDALLAATATISTELDVGAVGVKD